MPIANASSPLIHRPVQKELLGAEETDGRWQARRDGAGHCVTQRYLGEAEPRCRLRSQ